MVAKKKKWMKIPAHSFSLIQPKIQALDDNDFISVDAHANKLC